jgi:hypothetical protein
VRARVLSLRWLHAAARFDCASQLPEVLSTQDEFDGVIACTSFRRSRIKVPMQTPSVVWSHGSHWTEMQCDVLERAIGDASSTRSSHERKSGKCIVRKPGNGSVYSRWSWWGSWCRCISVRRGRRRRHSRGLGRVELNSITPKAINRVKQWRLYPRSASVGSIEIPVPVYAQRLAKPYKAHDLHKQG